MQSLDDHLSRCHSLNVVLLLTHHTLPVLLSLVLQAAASCGKERAGYHDRLSHHIPKNRGPNVPDEQRLLDHIMKGYERSVRPVRNSTTAVVIKMGLTLTQVLDMKHEHWGVLPSVLNNVRTVACWVREEFLHKIIAVSLGSDFLSNIS
ncbi:hypothetical protein Btru_016417 [Bulinus truncatus]|nr:hypothetical protein Btru_016417 [Bulinus truncatus]